MSIAGPLTGAILKTLNLETSPLEALLTNHEPPLPPEETEEISPVSSPNRSRTQREASDVEKGIALERSRLELENRAQGGMRAYLISVEMAEDDPATVQEDLQELGALVRSLGDDCVGATVQKRAKITPHTLIGSGKAEEIRLSCKQLDVNYVVCDKDLSPSQVRNLEKIIQLPILDRTGIILQIFRKNAKTREAKTQVEIAHFEYLLPRLSNSWIAFERQRGSSSSASHRVRGAGEMQIEMDRRRLRDKIAFLRKDLERIKTERSTQRKSRSTETNVVLVGYTNAGKTTIMNGLTDSHLSANNNLFETLDSAVRVLKGAGNPRILVTDTVGFIQSLPHSLVASFHSTLEETAHADLLVHVVDASHPRYQEQIRVTEEVLQSVGAGEVPKMYVFNKVDAVAGGARVVKILARSYPNHICICAENKEDIKRLRDALEDYFAKNMEERTLEFSYADNEKFKLVYLHTRVLSMIPTDDGAVFKVRAPTEVFKRYFDTSSPEPESSKDEERASDEKDPWDSGEFSYQKKE
jgi:GTP-binding protein HflX